jgi:hypothetical protein
MKSAWLITWESLSEHLQKDNKIASILNYRRSWQQVQRHVEWLYVNSEYSLSERLAYAKSVKNNPYPSMHERGHITCGHDPFLLARKVRNLHVENDSNGQEHLKWEEIPR